MIPEQSDLVPLANGAWQVVELGDRFQLPPFVLSPEAHVSGRAISDASDACGIPEPAVLHEHDHEE